jgi:hypothetical protein
VKDANPGAWDYAIDPKIAPFAEQLNASLAAGIEPTRAYELAHRNVYEQTKEEQEILKTQYAASPKQTAENLNQLQDDLDSDDSFDSSWRTSSPDAVLAMQGEYQRLVGQYYVSTNGDLGTARKLASTVVRSGYGVTEMNGVREVVKNAPEKNYPGLTSEIIRADLAKSLAAVDPTLDPMKARIVPTADTDRTKGRVWGVALYDEDGNYDVVRDAKNRPLPYSLPLGEDFAVLRQAALVAEVEKAVRAAAEAKKRDVRSEGLSRSQMDEGMR